jgi:hypothetical protein
MKWNLEADDAIKKVPFFVRKKVRARVEKEAREAGKQVVTLVDVKRPKSKAISWIPVSAPMAARTGRRSVMA